MSNDTRSSLIAVIAKVEKLAADNHEGKVYDNILAIFNRLTTLEKRILLKGLINICFIVEDKVLINYADLEDLRDQVLKGQTDVSARETNNKLELAKELVKLKAVVIKSSIAAVVCLVLVIEVMSGQLDVDASVLKTIATWLAKLVGGMFF